MEFVGVIAGIVAAVFVVIFGGRGLVDLARGAAERRRARAGPPASGSVEAGAEARSAPLRQDVRFTTTTDGVRICYATVGQGPALVKAGHWLTHVEFEWQSPAYQRRWEPLFQERTFVRYDERGNGLSDWEAPALTLEGWVTDMEAVVDALGLERFALLGISQGASTSIEYATRHPERVSHVVLLGGYARGWALRGEQERIERQALVALTREGWGRDNPAYRQVFTSKFMPDASEEVQDYFNEMELASASPEGAVRLQEASGVVDVEYRLRDVSAPTLVLHSRGDAVTPFEEGRRMAAAIPGARFVALESRNHVLQPDEPAWDVFVSEVRRFLAED